MDFLESPRFPECVSIVASMGPVFKTYVSDTAAGVETRDQQWATSRTQFSFEHVGFTQEMHQSMLAFFDQVAGRAGGFRVRHPADYALSSSTSQLSPQILGAGVGTPGFGYGVPIYLGQRLKTYGSITRTKDILKPVSGGISALRAGSPVVIGAGDGQVGIDTTTGLFTFVNDQSQSISSHVTGASHEFTAASPFSPNFVSGTGRVYITGVTGSAATVLNGLSHGIDNVAGATITLSTSTNTLTASGGTAHYYPQPTETLTLNGEFDYPCRFTSDEARFVIVGKNVDAGLIWNWVGIDLIEVKGE